MKYIKFFKEITRKNSSLFGGKTATLGDMLKSGLPVPDGFGISIKAHEEFKNRPFSDEFKQELYEAYKILNAERVAVRSSAIAEDSQDASWAGQLETFLNVTESTLEKSIKACWQSINTEHARDYATDKNLQENDLFVGVCVQSMIDSECAGVMFTVNPVTKNRKEIIIESSFGLGEAVVQGTVTPDNFVITKKPFTVIEFNISIKNTMFTYTKGATRTVDVPKGLCDRASLKEEQVLALAKLGIIIEKKYRRSQDIEWAYFNDRFYIIQARPVTTL